MTWDGRGYFDWSRVVFNRGIPQGLEINLKASSTISKTNRDTFLQEPISQELGGMLFFASLF